MYYTRLIGGHEFLGTVVSMGSSFHPAATDRPELYATLRIGDKVVSPFTVSCGECQYVHWVTHLH